MTYPVGSLVVTPLNRIAKVTGPPDGDGKLPLMYQDIDVVNATRYTPSLAPKLLRPVIAVTRNTTTHD